MSARRLLGCIGLQPHIAPIGGGCPSIWMGGFNAPAFLDARGDFGLRLAAEDAVTVYQSHERDTSP